MIKEMMGEAMAGRLIASAESGTFGSDVAGYAIDQAFGGGWADPVSTASSEASFRWR